MSATIDTTNAVTTGFSLVTLLTSKDFWLAVTAVIAAASAIANVTPSDSDNKIVATISGIVNSIALNFKK